MTPEQQHIVRIFGEATEPLFLSDITGSLNTQLSSGGYFNTSEVIKNLESLYEQVTQLRDGRWTLKRRVG
jgi:hypothetical protein